MTWIVTCLNAWHPAHRISQAMRALIGRVLLLVRHTLSRDANGVHRYIESLEKHRTFSGYCYVLFAALTDRVVRLSSDTLAAYTLQSRGSLVSQVRLAWRP